MFFDAGSCKIKWLRVLMGFVVLNIALIVLSMIPGWIIAGNFKSEITNYSLFIFNSIERTSTSINELEKEIISYNKMKFIESNKIEKSNFIVHLQENSEPIIQENRIEIKLLNDQQIEKMVISKISNLSAYRSINITTNPENILNNIIPKYCHPFYSFKMSKTFNPLLTVMPRVLFILFLFTFSAISIAFYITIMTGLLYKEKNTTHAKEFTLSKNFNAAQLNLLGIILENVYEDLNYVFDYSRMENNDSKISYEKRMDEIRHSLGRIIVFRTRRREYSEINLSKEINIVLDCCLDQISKKDISIIKDNVSDIGYIHQTRIKNLLILFSIICHFIMNLPPKGQLTIDVKKENNDLVRVKFTDNMPLNWKLFEFANSPFKGLNYLFLPYDKLMLACADEDIKAEKGNDLMSNFFILEYKLNQHQQLANVIKGNFR